MYETHSVVSEPSSRVNRGLCYTPQSQPSNRAPTLPYRSTNLAANCGRYYMAKCLYQLVAIDYSDRFRVLHCCCIYAWLRTSSSNHRLTFSVWIPNLCCPFAETAGIAPKLGFNDHSRSLTPCNTISHYCYGSKRTTSSCKYARTTFSLGDSSLGLGNLHSYASGYALGIAVAAIWNRHFMRANAFALGHELYQKDVNVALGPLGTLQCFYGGGTNYEDYGSAPFVVGVNCAEYVIGLQSAGVQSNPKQYAGYDTQKLHRFSYSSNIPDKSFHEVYSWPYAEAIKAGASSIMCAYNLINNTQACEISKAINGILKAELGF